MKRAREEDLLPAAKVARYDDDSGGAVARPLDLAELVAEEIVTWVGPASQHAMRFVCKRWHAWIPPVASLPDVVRDVVVHGHAGLFVAWPAFFTAERMHPLVSGMSTWMALYKFWESAIRENRLDWITPIANGCHLPTLCATENNMDDMCSALVDVDVPRALSFLHGIRVELTHISRALHPVVLLTWMVRKRPKNGLIDVLIDELRASGPLGDEVPPVLSALERILMDEEDEAGDTNLAWRLVETIGWAWPAQHMVRFTVCKLLGHFGPINVLVRIWERGNAFLLYRGSLAILHDIRNVQGAACVTPLYDWAISWLPPLTDANWRDLFAHQSTAMMSAILRITPPKELGDVITRSDPAILRDQWAQAALGSQGRGLTSETWCALFRCGPLWPSGLRTLYLESKYRPHHDRTIYHFLATVPFDYLPATLMVFVDGRPVTQPTTLCPALQAAERYYPTHRRVLGLLWEVGNRLELPEDTPNPVAERLLARAAAEHEVDDEDAEKWALLRDVAVDAES